MVEVLACQSPPAGRRHATEQWVIGPITLTSVRGKGLEKRVERGDVASPFMGLGAESFGWSLRSVRPWYHIDHQPAYRGKTHRPESNWKSTRLNSSHRT